MWSLLVSDISKQELKYYSTIWNFIASQEMVTLHHLPKVFLLVAISHHYPDVYIVLCFVECWPITIAIRSVSFLIDIHHLKMPCLHVVS